MVPTVIEFVDFIGGIIAKKSVKKILVEREEFISRVVGVLLRFLLMGFVLVLRS